LLKLVRILLYSFLLNRFILFSETKWKQHGITVAGGNGRGKKLNQLSSPRGIFIDDNQTIYIADFMNDRIVEWEFNATNGKIVAGEKSC
jgi:sugar lactone lactonase YvrE